MFGLAPILGSRATQALAQSHTGTELLLSTVSSVGLHAAFIVFALPTGWVAWKRLQTVARKYEAKEFSDAQLLARAWWLMFIAGIALDILNRKASPLWAVVACAAAYPVFVFVNRYAVRWVGLAAENRDARHLLLLRVFGYTSRTEKAFRSHRLTLEIPRSGHDDRRAGCRLSQHRSSRFPVLHARRDRRKLRALGGGLRAGSRRSICDVILMAAFA